MIEKGVLHLDQNEFGGGERKENEKRNRKDRKKRKKRGRKRKKKKGKMEEMRSSFYWSPVFEQ